MKLELSQGCSTVGTIGLASLQVREIRIADVQCSQAASSSFSSWLPELGPGDNAGEEVLHWQEETSREQQRNRACLDGLEREQKDALCTREQEGRGECIQEREHEKKSVQF